MTAVHSPRRSGGAPGMPCSPGLLTIAQIVTSHKLPSGAGQACQTALLRMLQTAMHRAQDKHALLRMLPLMPPVPHPSLTSVKPFNLHITLTPPLPIHLGPPNPKLVPRIRPSKPSDLVSSPDPTLSRGETVW